MSGPARTVRVVRAGLVPYRAALAWQRELAAARIAGRLRDDVLLLLEHPSVVTLGRTARATHVLRGEGVEVVDVERGGDVTYHGPGQLVGYPILDLRGYRQDLHWYLRTLEQTLVFALRELGIAAARRPGFTGVWTVPAGRKIASIGVHVKQWVTWHGFALNVTTDLAQFDRIVPCGIPGVVMTSVERERGGAADRRSLWEAAVTALIRGFERAFGVTAEPGGAADFSPSARPPHAAPVRDQAPPVPSSS
jgi:lipoate-protein ligase B